MVKKQSKQNNWIIIGILLFMGLNLIFNKDFPNQIAPYRQIIGGIAVYRAWLVYKKG